MLRLLNKKMVDVQKLLEKYWGYPAFRPLQADIIAAVLSGKDVLALLPTGGGKSICFQIPALAKPGICLVITPLIALMKDQVAQLQKKGIPAAAIFTGMTYAAMDIILDNCIHGPIKFLYVSPERIQTEIFQIRLSQMNVNLLAIDEAHCISQWGYDFRPAYLNIAQIRPLLSHVNVIALTATATRAVKEDIQAKLHFKNSLVFQKSFARNNLSYLVKKTDNKQNYLLRLIKRMQGATVIVYTNTRKKTKEIANFLIKNDISATFYHGGLSNAEREERQDAWIHNKVKVMVATNAFGMGIDKPDVRLVVHCHLPTTLEAYYQEAGRAGRDEKLAYAMLLYDQQDIIDLRESIAREYPTIVQLKRVYQHLANHYQLAVGVQDKTSYDFDFESFAITYRLHSQDVYHALKKLATEGLIELTQTFFEPPQLHIPVLQQEIYAFQVENASYVPLIKTILRLYGGELFTNFCPISITKIAHQLGVKDQMVKKKIEMLHQQKIFRYIPQKEKPQITFLQPRFAASQLPLDVKALQQKSMLARQKAEAVIDYATHQVRCRAQLLLEYFDEISYLKCRSCDICSPYHTRLTAAEQASIEELVLKRIKEGPCSLHDLADYLILPEEKLAIVVRSLLERDQLAYNMAYELIIDKKVEKKNIHKKTTFVSSNT